MTRVDRFWVVACAAGVLAAFVLLATRTVIERHQFARAHSLDVDYGEMTAELLIANGVASCAIVLYVFAIPLRIALNAFVPSRWQPYRWETLWLLIVFGILSLLVYVMATTKLDG